MWLWEVRAYHLESIRRAQRSLDVIQGGVAGCCLASRLSEDPTVTVLLIERGTVQDSWLSRIPLPSSNHVRDGALSILTPAETSTLLNNRALTVSIGYGLGGGCLVNS